MNSHSSGATGITESRLPRRTRGRPASSGQALSSGSVIVRESLRPKRTSTRNQRGLSGSLLGSKCLSAASKAVGSGYAAVAISMIPTMPGTSQLEW